MKEKIGSLMRLAEQKGFDKVKLSIIAVALLGIILIVISSFSDSKENEAGESTSYAQFSEHEYRAQLEAELEEMIASLYGAGRTKVVITLECDYETVYAKDGSYSKDEMSSDEESEYIIIGGEKQEGGLVLKTVTPKVRGVAVLCEGGANPDVEAAVSEMLCALLNIGTNHISVSKIQ